MIRAATHQEITILCNHTGLVPTPYCKGISLVLDNRTVAVVGYDRWTENAVEMHIWLENARYMKKSFIREAFSYPFIQGDRGLVIGITPGNNAPALEFNRRLGFTQVHRIVDGNAVGEDLVIQEMRRDNCKWIRTWH